jgi:hypothetical protein
MKVRFFASAVLAILLLSSFAFGDCEPNWKPGNGPQGVSDYVMTLINWDPDGNGPQQEQLVASGRFTSAGGVAANRIATWDGNTWNPLGSGLSIYARSLAIYNGELIAGGNFPGALRWNGSVWQPLGGMNGMVYSMAVYNGQLIVGGNLGSIGSNVARWDGNDWYPMDSTTGGVAGSYINAFTVYNGELIAGGDFNFAGGVECNRIARWDGSAWQSMGSGMNYSVRTFAFYNNELIAGGSFTTAGGTDANYVARWDGSGWRPLGKGITGVPGPAWSDVRALIVYNNELIAGGGFNKAGEIDVNKIARWDGNSWQSLGSGILGAGILALTVYNGELLAGGDFVEAGGVTVNRISQWDGSEWHAFGNGIGLMPGSNQPPVQCLTVNKNELIAGGRFTTAGGVDVNYIARWDGKDWKPLGSGVNPSGQFSIIYGLTVYNDELIAGGIFTRVGGVDANCVARWDGSVWHPLGSGITSRFPSVKTLKVYNSELIAGGDFNFAGDIEANKIAVWNGLGWHSLGSGLRVGDGQKSQSGYAVRALTVYNGELIAGGDFNNAGGVDVNGIARWDGSAWQPLGSGVSGTRFFVQALIPFEGKLIAAGSFSKAGGIDVNNIASWDGNSWQPLGSGLNGWVYSLTIYNGQLIAGGYFAKAGGVSVNGIARWDGIYWQPMSSGMSGSYPYIVALTSYKGELIAGGWSEYAGGIPSVYWARWGVPEPIEGDLNHDCALDLFDLQLLVERWLNDDCLQSGWCYEADLNYDSAVDFSDFADFAAAWLYK